MMAFLAAGLLLAAASPGFSNPEPVVIDPSNEACSTSGSVNVDTSYDNDSDNGSIFAYVDLYIGTAGLFADVQSIAEIDDNYVPDGDPIPGTYAYHAGLGIDSSGEATYPHRARSGGSASSTFTLTPEEPCIGNCLIDFGEGHSTSGNGTGISGGALLDLADFGDITMGFSASGGYHYGFYSTVSGPVSVGTQNDPTPSPNGSYWAQIPDWAEAMDFAVSTSLSYAEASPSSGTSTYTSTQFVSVAFYGFTDD